MTYPIISAQSTTLTDVIELREPHVFVENQIWTDHIKEIVAIVN